MVNQRDRFFNRRWQAYQLRVTSEKTIQDGYAAYHWYGRWRGLLGYATKDLPLFLWLPRCSAVHTFGMRTPIDIIFLSKKKEILAVHLAVPAGRLCFHWSADSVLELPPWQAQAWRLGQRVDLQSRIF